MKRVSLKERKNNASPEDVVKRLLLETNKLKQFEDYGVYAEPSKKSILIWDGYVLGPENSPYEGGKFYLTLRFPRDYPVNPPLVKFKSRILHPNIFFNGEICLEELENEWDSRYDVFSILLIVQHLLREPNFSSPANPKATTIYRSDKEQYYIMVKEYMKKKEDDEY